MKKLNCSICYYVESKKDLQITHIKISEREDRLEAINTLLNYLNSEGLKLMKITLIRWY